MAVPIYIFKYIHLKEQKWYLVEQDDSLLAPLSLSASLESLAAYLTDLDAAFLVEMIVKLVILISYYIVLKFKKKQCPRNKYDICRRALYGEIKRLCVIDVTVFSNIKIWQHRFYCSLHFGQACRQKNGLAGSKILQDRSA